jgi:hypothetical protein
MLYLNKVVARFERLIRKIDSFHRYLFRLYWFPLKILYSCGVVAVHRAYYRGAGLYGFFNTLLWILLILDLYWFYVNFLDLKIIFSLLIFSVIIAIFQSLLCCFCTKLQPASSAKSVIQEILKKKRTRRRKINR